MIGVCVCVCVPQRIDGIFNKFYLLFLLMNIGPIILYDYLSVCTYNGTEIIIYYGFETLD